MKNLTVLKVDDSGNYSFRNVPKNVRLVILDMGLDVPLHEKSEVTNPYDRYLTTREQLEYETQLVIKWFHKQVKKILSNKQPPEKGKSFVKKINGEIFFVTPELRIITGNALASRQALTFTLYHQQIFRWLKKLPNKKK